MLKRIAIILALIVIGIMVLHYLGSDSGSKQVDRVLFDQEAIYAQARHNLTK